MLIKEMIKSICHSHTAASRTSSTALPFIWQYEINVGDRHSTYPHTVKTTDMNSNFYLSTHGSGRTQLQILEGRQWCHLLTIIHSTPQWLLLLDLINFTTLISFEMQCQQAPLMAKQDSSFLLVQKHQEEREKRREKGVREKTGRKKKQEGLARDLLCILQEKKEPKHDFWNVSTLVFNITSTDLVL